MVTIFIGCVLCDVQEQAEEKVQHRAYSKKIAEPDGKTPMYEINARLFFFGNEKLSIKEAVM